MNDLSSLNEGMVFGMFARAIKDVYATLLGIPRQRELPPAPPPMKLGRKIFVSIGLAGEIQGVIYLAMDETLAARSVDAILCARRDTEQSEENFDEAMSEISNMMVAGFKNQLCDSGFACMLGLPSVIRGENMYVREVVGTTRFRFQYLVSGLPLIADIMLRMAAS
jgi:CheY-specific phosphatase CheX